MGVCLSQELIERYLVGSCSADELQTIEAHLAECESCRQQVGSARSKTNSSDNPDSVSPRKDAPDASVEVTRVLDDGIQAKSVPKPPELSSGKQDSARPVEKTRVLEDEYPPKSVPQPTTFPPGKQSFAKTLESMIEGYEILEEMPRGGQAAVYKAIHTATKTKVAIKVLLPTLLASARARYYFEREADLIASLDHPNIVSIRDSGIIHHQYYFVMQYIDGQPLERYVRSEKLSFRETVILFNKICTAITYAHQQGVIHRDLKFANILVDKRGEPHVLDFGLAKAIGLSEQSPNKAVATMTGQLSGTLSTMSPEQAAGRPDLIDVRTDVYSLGVILYRMLTRRYPYEVVGSTLEVLQNIQKTDPVRPRQINRKFDSDVEAILLTALAKDPTERYQSTAELQSDIRNWLEGRPIRVKSISTAYLLRKIIARHRYTSTVAALLLLIIVGFAYVSFDLYLTTKKAKQESEDYAAHLTMQIARSRALERESAFTMFLEAWRQNNNFQAAFVFHYMSEGSKEKKAARFLGDPNPVADKESDFRNSLTDENSWFAEFIIGENHLKNKNHQKALEAFRRSHEAAGQSPPDEKTGTDKWLLEEIERRIGELSAADKSTQNNERPAAGN